MKPFRWMLLIAMFVSGCENAPNIPFGHVLQGGGGDNSGYEESSGSGRSGGYGSSGGSPFPSTSPSSSNRVNPPVNEAEQSNIDIQRMETLQRIDEKLGQINSALESSSR